MNISKAFTFISYLLFIVSTLYAKDLGVDVVLLQPTPTPSPTAVPARSRMVTFVFSSDFVGTVAGRCFAGTAGACGTNQPADDSLTLTAPAGDTLVEIPYTCSAGSVRVIRTQ